YEAYSDYIGVAAMAEEMVATVAEEALGSIRFEFRGNEIDLTPPWHRLTLHDALRDYGDLDIDEYSTAETLRPELERRGLTLPSVAGWGKLVDEAMSHYVEPKLIQPTFLLDYPVELSPLAKRKPDNPRLGERFAVVLGGVGARQHY